MPIISVNADSERLCNANSVMQTLWGSVYTQAPERFFACRERQRERQRDRVLLERTAVLEAHSSFGLSILTLRATRHGDCPAVLHCTIQPAVWYGHICPWIYAVLCSPSCVCRTCFWPYMLTLLCLSPYYASLTVYASARPTLGRPTIAGTVWTCTSAKAAVVRLWRFTSLYAQNCTKFLNEVSFHCIAQLADTHRHCQKVCKVSCNALTMPADRQIAATFIPTSNRTLNHFAPIKRSKC